MTPRKVRGRETASVRSPLYTGHSKSQICKKRPLLRRTVKDCLFCGKVLRSLWHLDEHMNSHTRERPYRCIHCYKDFTVLGSFNLHKKSAHKTEFKCASCEKAYPTMPLLLRHNKRHHVKDAVLEKAALAQMKMIVKHKVIMTKGTSVSGSRKNVGRRNRQPVKVLQTILTRNWNRGRKGRLNLGVPEDGK